MRRTALLIFVLALALPATAAEGGVDAHAIDPDIAARLWTVSVQLTGVDAFATA